MRTHTELASAQMGVVVVNDTSTIEQTFHAIYVLEDTIFATILDESGNTEAEYITDPTATVKAGAFITPFERQKPFSELELISGSVSLIL